MAIPVCVSNLRRNQQQSSGSCRLAECSPRIWEMMRPDARGETTERVAVGAHGYRVWRGRVWATGRHFVKHTCFLPRVDFILGWFFSFFSWAKMAGFYHRSCRETNVLERVLKVFTPFQRDRLLMRWKQRKRGCEPAERLQLLQLDGGPGFGQLVVYSLNIPSMTSLCSCYNNITQLWPLLIGGSSSLCR